MQLSVLRAASAGLAALALGGISATDAQAFRKKLDRLTPTASRARCRDGRPAWRVVWLNSDAVYVTSNRRVALDCR